jgi:hypothetical protein
MKPDTWFWLSIEKLLIINSIIVDRPKGTSHPRYKNAKTLTGILCTFDTLTKCRRAHPNERFESITQ